ERAPHTPVPSKLPLAKTWVNRSSVTSLSVRSTARSVLLRIPRTPVGSRTSARRGGGGGGGGECRRRRGQLAGTGRRCTKRSNATCAQRLRSELIAECPVAGATSHPARGDNPRGTAAA